MKLRWWILTVLAGPMAMVILWSIAMAIDHHRSVVSRAYVSACDAGLAAAGYDPKDAHTIAGPAYHRVCWPIFLRMGVAPTMANTCITQASIIGPHPPDGSPGPVFFRAIPLCNAVFPDWFWEQ